MSWFTEEMGGVDLRDKRLDTRAITLLNNLVVSSLKQSLLLAKDGLKQKRLTDFLIITK